MRALAKKKKKEIAIEYAFLADLIIKLFLSEMSKKLVVLFNQFEVDPKYKKKCQPWKSPSKEDVFFFNKTNQSIIIVSQ